MYFFFSDIADNRQIINDINDRHIPLHIRSKLCCFFNLDKMTCLLDLFSFFLFFGGGGGV